MVRCSHLSVTDREGSDDEVAPGLASPIVLELLSSSIPVVGQPEVRSTELELGRIPKRWMNS